MRRGEKQIDNYYTPSCTFHRFHLAPPHSIPGPFPLPNIADDGTCCRPDNRVRLQSEALVLVQIQDVNNKKPHFPNCTRYSPMVYENEPRGTHVITVSGQKQNTSSRLVVKNKTLHHG